MDIFYKPGHGYISTGVSALDKSSYFARGNSEIIESYYQDYIIDPNSVDIEWRRFFEGLELGLKREVGASSGGNEFIGRMRNIAYKYADLDPLGLEKPDFKALPKELGIEGYNESEAVTDKALNKMGIKTAGEALEFLKRTYCGKVAVQTPDLPEKEQNFFIEKFEIQGPVPKLAKDQKIQTLHELTSVEAMEKFLHTRFVGMKRFSIEGTDTGVTLLETLIQNSNMDELVIGMAHRGRINVLTNFMGKAIKTVLAEFEGIVDPGVGSESGDVKYHMGFSADRETARGNVHISLAFNPSHLEFVGPVVCGTTWAKQFIKKQDTKRVMPVIIHGDAAFAGQGVVYETFQMARLKAHDVGGTVHIIFDNQVGFTANPFESRSTDYSSDLAKAFSVPILHVNADDVEACIRAGQIACEYRELFQKDILIRLNGYRRHGHNEGDEPAYTQPKMYSVIKKHPTVREIYGKKLVSDGIITSEEVEEKYKAKIEQLQGFLDEVKKEAAPKEDNTIGGAWKGLKWAKDEKSFFKPVNTSVKKADVDKVFHAMTNPPPDFNWNPKLKRQYEKLFENYSQNGILNWTLAEMAAYGGLVLEGTDVRITGQDAVRGTFSHRHSMYTDMENEKIYSPLATLNSGNADLYVYNSFLSETAVMGFDYGVSTANPWMLTIWEAQFGDFTNGAQVIIDQFLVAAEAKWNRMSGLVLLLPHGYEGQGPEHSSARLERFLNLCTNLNIQVCYPTTPAQIFHLLRRQVKREFRKPLVIMSPKSLLRHPKVVSNISEITDSKVGFKEVIGDKEAKSEKVKELLLCTGKVYYDLIEAKEKESGGRDAAIVRIEQIYPFPDQSLRQIIESYKNLEVIKWVQEEPRNMGAYRFVSSYIWQILRDFDIKKGYEYVGRAASASPATGSPKHHSQEQRAIITTALKIK